MKTTKILGIIAGTAIFTISSQNLFAQQSKKEKKDSIEVVKGREGLKEDRKEVVGDLKKGDTKEAKSDYKKLRKNEKEVKADKKEWKATRKRRKSEEIK